MWMPKHGTLPGRNVKAVPPSVQGKARTKPLCEAKREDIIHSVTEFLGRSRPFDVLIVSYETFRIHKGLFLKPGAAPVDLMLCDEAHRLKNADSQLSVALNELPCRRRVLLSGTPMQNHLDEVPPPPQPCVASSAVIAVGGFASPCPPPGFLVHATCGTAGFGESVCPLCQLF